MNIANAKDLVIIHGLPPVAVKGDRVSIDSEFFGQDKKRLHRPHGRFAYLGCSYDGKTVYYITDEDEVSEFYSRIGAAVHIYHHAKYDIRQLRRYADIPDRNLLWDTMLVEQIMYSGYYTDFSLADLVRRYCRAYMPKEVRQEFSDDTVLEMTKEQIEYACVDVAYTWRVAKEQRAIISEDDLNIWKDIELPFMWVLLSMSGIKLDVEKWTALALHNEKVAKEIQDEYGHWESVGGKKKQTFVGINLNSPAQVKKHLLDCGAHVKSTDAEALEKIVSSGDGHDAAVIFAARILTYRTYAKRASTYGLKFIEDFVEPDGKIYADMYQIGAETGRCSCRAPNLQNQPHETEYRECFISDGDDECIIVADWGSQEPRIAAYLSEDQGLMDALNSNEKLYIRVARDVLGKEIKKDSDEYKHIKSTVLGIFYGMSAKGLADRIGVDENVAQEYIDSFLETYPGVKEYMRKQYRAKDFVTSIYGRKTWLNKYSFQWQRNALNAPIQSSAADAMKIAASRFNDKWFRELGDYEERETPKPTNNSPITLLVHDEIVLRVPKSLSEVAKKLLSSVMIDVAEDMHDGIKGSVDIFPVEGFSNNWACKH